MRLLIGLGLVALLATPGTARAYDLRCEGRLLGYGTSIDEVLQLCGPPARRVETARVIYDGLWDSPISGQTRVPVEIWTYETPGEFTRKVIFVAGRLEKVETGGYPGF